MSYSRIWFALLMIAFICNQSCTCASKDTVKIDGSSTVYILSEAIAEEYQREKHGKVSIGMSGTGGGFKKLCSNRVNIIGASRAITEQEIELCKSNNVDIIELPIAFDGIVVVVNKGNNWLNHISTSTLKKIFEPAAEGKINMWSDIDPTWPARRLEIFAPGISSGTYDYFTAAIVGKRHASRGDITTSEDDNVLVHGVRTTLDAIGFFGFAYYRENASELKALPIIDDKSPNSSPVMPDRETIRSGAYHPLSRVVYMYANRTMSVHENSFLQFYLENSQKMSDDVGFIPLSGELHAKALRALQGDK